MRLGAMLAVLAVSAAALAPVSASAASPDPELPDLLEQSPTTHEGHSLGPDDPIAGDAIAASYALDYGVTLAEATRRLDRIEPLHLLLESIRSTESDRVAGWGIDHTPEFAGWVLLTGNQPASSAAIEIADLHSDIEVRLGAAHTLVALTAAQDAFAAGAHVGPVGSTADGTGGIDVATVVTFTLLDMEDNALHIGIDPALASAAEPEEFGDPGDMGPVGTTGDGSTSDAQFQAMKAMLTTALANRIGVTHEIIDGRGTADDAVLDGGREMGSCTSGFAARYRRTGDYGIITAGHCRNSLSLNGVNLPWVAGYKNISADAQFHRVPEGSGHELRSTFECNVPAPRGTCDVASEKPRYRMAGNYVCHTGKNSGLSCGTVTSIHYQPVRSSDPDAQPPCTSSTGVELTCNAVFVRVHGASLKSCKGDSGGPWYNRSIAFGIHKGSTGGGDCERLGVYAHFSSVGEVEQFLGADLLHRQTVRFIG